MSADQLAALIVIAQLLGVLTVVLGVSGMLGVAVGRWLARLRESRTRPVPPSAEVREHARRQESS